MKQGWKKYLFYSGVVLVIGGLIYMLVETVKADRTGFETKTLWDWMELLIIPAVLAGGAILLNRSERALERKTAEDRAKLERDLATDRQQEAALQTYFDRMSELLLKEKLRTTENVEVRDVARTRTLSIMRGLDTKRNKLILQFLSEAQLITDENSIFNRANMSEMNLEGVNLWDVFLKGAHLWDVNLVGAILWGANLQGANLARANLQGANLVGTNLQGANLEFANLQGAELVGANLQGANLQGANLEGANLVSVNLQGANLQGANLQGADLKGANLQDAFMMSANLASADLDVANLVGANLNSVDNISDEQLASVKSLKGATMPDGTKYE